jgi:hypothetical protein
MKIRRKLRMGMKNLSDRIVLTVPLVDSIHEIIMSFLRDWGFPTKKLLSFDFLFNEFIGNYYYEKYKKYEIEIFIKENDVTIILRFPKKEKNKIMNLIDNYFFFPDENTPDVKIKIEADEK